MKDTIPTIEFPASPRFIDRTNITYGRLTAQAYLGRRGHDTIWYCKCVCGTYVKVGGSMLSSKNTQSCGCLKQERIVDANIKHNKYYTPTYKIWAGMKSRCQNSAVECYMRYGGRGIKVCERWQQFENFLADMGERPSPKHSIERKDNNGNYEPDNCYWATIKEQSRNTRRNHNLTFQGLTHCITEWEEILGYPAGLIGPRLRLGWTVERALSTPARVSTRTRIRLAQPE